MEHTVRIIDRDLVVNDSAFWRSRPATERLEALEMLRQQYIRHINAEQRLQRVCRVVERTRR
ncbi:MAG: hypothetical protein WAU70_02105 [Flavobacteriales bacterium]